LRFIGEVSPKISFFVDILFDSHVPIEIRQKMLENYVRLIDLGKSVDEALRLSLQIFLDDVIRITKKKPTNILCFSENSLHYLLDALGLTNYLEAGKLVCSVCGTPLTYANIGSIAIINGNPIIVCNELNCYFKLMDIYRKTQLGDLKKGSKH